MVSHPFPFVRTWNLRAMEPIKTYGCNDIWYEAVIVFKQAQALRTYFPLTSTRACVDCLACTGFLPIPTTDVLVEMSVASKT